MGTSPNAYPLPRYSLTAFVRVCVQGELRQEHAQRVSAQAVIEQHKQQLADLKLEASVLRQASAEHARCPPSVQPPLPCCLTTAMHASPFQPVCCPASNPADTDACHSTGCSIA